MPCCDCASMCSTARRDLERRGAWRSPSHIRNSVPIILHGIWTGCLTFATSILLFQFCRLAARARARLPFGFRYPDAARPTQVSRSLRVAGAAFRLPVPPRACCCSWPFRGRAAGALAQPSRTGVKRKRRSLGLARAPSETVTQSRAPETAGASGVGATVSPCAVCAPLRAAAAAKLRCRVCGVSARNQHTPRRRPGRRDERRPHLKATPRTVPQRRTPDTWTVFDMVTTGIILDMSTCIR